MAIILVVEDNPVNMKLAVLLLLHAGHEVLCATDAESALLMVQESQPNLILMDFELPGMNGSTATSLLKQNSTTAHIPVIILTATAAKLGLDNGGQVGHDAILAKPIRYQELYHVIDCLLEKQPWQTQDDKNTRNIFLETPKIEQQAQKDILELTGPVVDLHVLERLVGNDEQVILEFLIEFRGTSASIAQQLKRAYEVNQPELVGRHAHKLKSAAYAVGAIQLGEYCSTIENLGKQGLLEEFHSQLPMFESELTAVNNFIDDFIERKVITSRLFPFQYINF